MNYSFPNLTIRCNLLCYILIDWKIRQRGLQRLGVGPLGDLTEFPRGCPHLPAIGSGTAGYHGPRLTKGWVDLGRDSNPDPSRGVRDTENLLNPTVSTQNAMRSQTTKHSRNLMLLSGLTARAHISKGYRHTVFGMVSPQPNSRIINGTFVLSLY